MKGSLYPKGVPRHRLARCAGKSSEIAVRGPAQQRSQLLWLREGAHDE
jgi:hypothetical protein